MIGIWPFTTIVRRATRSFTSVINMTGAVSQTVNTTKRLAGLRELMNREDNLVKAYIVPSEDQRPYPSWHPPIDDIG